MGKCTGTVTERREHPYRTAEYALPFGGQQDMVKPLDPEQIEAMRRSDTRAKRRNAKRQQMQEELARNRSGKGVIVIPPQKTEPLPIDIAKLRVAAYCRVSTQEEQQVGSFEMQIHHFTRRIQANPNWELVEIYQDEGISATTGEKRLGFQKMIADAVDGKIDLILTKSISRFGRNIVDILEHLRTLSALTPPVSVEFETEGITYTGDGKNNLLIALLSALAEMESQQKSEAIKAGIRWRMAEGIYKFSVQNKLGYYRDHFGRLVIEPTEARIVEYIYESCLEGATPVEIAAALTAQGIKSPIPPMYCACWMLRQKFLPFGCAKATSRKGLNSQNPRGNKRES